MTCTRPVRLSEEMIVPCGRCVNCRIAHSREWATRIIHEASMYDDTGFVTLTYDDEHLPEDGGLRKKDFQDFLKLLRYHLGDVKIKYYMCGEYGEKNHRPHYHAIMFGVGYNHRKLVADVS